MEGPPTTSQVLVSASDLRELILLREERASLQQRLDVKARDLFEANLQISHLRGLKTPDEEDPTRRAAWEEQAAADVRQLYGDRTQATPVLRAFAHTFMSAVRLARVGSVTNLHALIAGLRDPKTGALLYPRVTLAEVHATVQAAFRG